MDTLSVLIKRNDGSIIVDMREISEINNENKQATYDVNNKTHELIWRLEDVEECNHEEEAG